MSGEVINLTPVEMRKLKQLEVDYLKNRIVKDLYADEPWKMMAYGVMLRHTNMVSYVRKEGVNNYGVEIEYSLRPTDYLTKQELSKCLAAGLRLELIKAGWGKNFSIEQDGSVPDGFELVLGPNDYETVFRTLLQVMRPNILQDYIDYGADNVGVHVTVDKFPHVWQKQLFMTVWNHPWFHTQWGHLIGRKPNEYCRLMAMRRDGTFEKDEYGIVKERENGAIEVRAFRNCGIASVIACQVRLVFEIDKWIRGGGCDISVLFDDMEKWEMFRGISAEKRS